jgi:hypothetical protein
MHANDAEENDVVMETEGFIIVGQITADDSESESWAVDIAHEPGEDEVLILELSTAFPTTPEPVIVLPGTEAKGLKAIPTGPRALTAHLPSKSHRPSERATSNQWLSAKELEIDRFLSTKTSLKKIAPESPFVPTTLHEWLTHRLERLEDRRQGAVAKLSRISQVNLPKKCEHALRGRTFSDNRSAVLALETIWTPWKSPDRAAAPWPTASEYKWEGDSRARSGFRRFPPIPRAVGNSTVVWHQKPAAEVYEFDRVGLSACSPFWEESSSLMREELMLDEDQWSSSG